NESLIYRANDSLVNFGDSYGAEFFCTYRAALRAAPERDQRRVRWLGSHAWAGTDAGLLGDLRHRHRPQPMLANEARCGVQDRVAHLSAVRLDRLVPKPRHQPPAYATAGSRHYDLK